MGWVGACELLQSTAWKLWATTAQLSGHPWALPGRERRTPGTSAASDQRISGSHAWEGGTTIWFHHSVRLRGSC